MTTERAFEMTITADDQALPAAVPTTALKEKPTKRESKRDIGGLSLQVLRTFVTVADTGSFSNTAKLLEVSQPTVSLQIANIEETFGVILFHRRPKPELTAIGREICNRARIILGRFSELETSLDQLKLLERGQLTIGISAPRLGLSLLAEFMRAFPSVAVRTVSGNSDDLLGQLEQNRIDAAVVALLDPIDTFAYTLVEDIHLCAWLPVNHPLVDREFMSLADVVDLPLVMRETGSVTRRLFERACAREGLTPQVRLQVHSRESVREAVAAGIAAGVVFNSEANSDSRVTSVPITPRITAGTYVVYLKEMSDLPTVKGLLDLVAGQLSLDIASG